MYVTSEVFIPPVRVGGSCYQNSGFALGQAAPAKATVLEASPYSKKGVEFIDIQRALRHVGSPLVLEKRLDIRHVSKLMEQSVGMFVGRGHIQTGSMSSAQPHFFSYDAGRRIFFDRAGGVVVGTSRHDA